METIKTIIVDDEPLARQELRYLLKGFSEIEIIDEAENVDEAKNKIEDKKPDLIFLDISMPEKSGFELLESLDVAPFVIFLTAYDEYAVRAFEENALDYLMKPTNQERIGKSIEKVKSEIKKLLVFKSEKKLTPEKRIFLKDSDKCFFVTLADVFLIESVGNYARFYFGKEKPLIHRTLNQIQERLDSTLFFRANRQQIFNINYVSKIDNYYKGGLKISLSTGQVVEVSNRNAVLFKELMSI
jgi:two-component system LytT family response regulator